jgi:hypothetical protein
MELLLALPGVITTCLLAWILLEAQERHANERRAEHEAHRTEIAHAARALLEEVGRHRIEVDLLSQAHREQLQNLIDTHRREVATLCQRIQAPQVAVAQHMPQDLPPDPPQIDLEDDAAMIEFRRREQSLDALARDLEDRAERLAAEAPAF